MSKPNGVRLSSTYGLAPRVAMAALALRAMMSEMESRAVVVRASRNFSPRNAFSVPASSLRNLSCQWVDRLAPYRRHRHVEHLEALVEESVRYAGLHLENDLSRSEYWSKAPLARRVAVLLFLVDRGAVNRIMRYGRRVFEPVDNAESWVLSQDALIPYRTHTLELVAAVRNEHARRTRQSLS